MNQRDKDPLIIYLKDYYNFFFIEWESDHLPARFHGSFFLIWLELQMTDPEFFHDKHCKLRKNKVFKRSSCFVFTIDFCNCISGP